MPDSIFDWFLELVKDSKDELSEKSYNKLIKNGNKEYKDKQNEYLIERIEAMYDFVKKIE